MNIVNPNNLEVRRVGRYVGVRCAYPNLPPRHSCEGGIQNGLDMNTWIPGLRLAKRAERYSLEHDA